MSSRRGDKPVNYNSKSRKASAQKKPRHLRAVDSISEPKKEKTEAKKMPKNMFSFLVLYVIRLAIVSVGLSVLSGTILSSIEKSQKQSVTNPSPQNAQPAAQPQKQGIFSQIELNQEMVALKTQLQALGAKYPKLQAGSLIVDLDNGNYVNINGDTTFSAASLIKIPILVAFFQDVDAGKIRLDEQLTMTKDVIGSGSGGMQYQKEGTKFSALETATKMITVSDNTATNMIIKRLGGAKVLNQRFSEWGLATTMIHNLLPDLEGTNKTTPRDLVYLLALVEKGDLVSLSSRDRIINIMNRTVTNTLLPKGLEKEANIAHKTGDIGSVLGDAGIIDMPNGKRYLAAVIVKRPHNDPAGGALIQQISSTVYQYLKAQKAKVK